MPSQDEGALRRSVTVFHVSQIKTNETTNNKRPASQPKTIPEECLFFDDTPSNLETARQLGFHTVLVRVSESEMTLVPTKYPSLNTPSRMSIKYHPSYIFYGLKLKDGVTIPPPFLSSS